MRQQSFHAGSKRYERFERSKSGVLQPVREAARVRRGRPAALYHHRRLKGNTISLRKRTHPGLPRVPATIHFPTTGQAVMPAFLAEKTTV